MSLDCVVYVRRNGTVRSGSKRDMASRVGDLIKGSEACYRAVINHAKKCSKCDPQEILEAYLNDRQRPKLGGLTSMGLVNLADRYAKFFPGRVKPETVQEFKWRIGKFSFLVRFEQELGAENMVRGAMMIHKAWADSRTPDGFFEENIKREMDRSEVYHSKYYWLFETIAILAANGIKIPPNRDELLKIAVISEVMAS